MKPGDRIRTHECKVSFTDFVYLFSPVYLKAQAEDRATMLRAQLEQRKKTILARINKEGKERLEKVWNFLQFAIIF